MIKRIKNNFFKCLDELYIFNIIQPQIVYIIIDNPINITDPITILVLNFSNLLFLCNSYAEFKNTYELLSNSSDFTILIKLYIKPSIPKSYSLLSINFSIFY